MRIPEWRGYPEFNDAVRMMMWRQEDWDRIGTSELIMYTRCQVGREYTAFRRKVKEILATREHVPNATERKKARQEKAKAQRNR